MSLEGIAYSSNLDAVLKSVKTVGDTTVGGDLRVSGTLFADDIEVDNQNIDGDLTVNPGDEGETGDVIIQSGDLILHRNPDSSTVGRTEPRHIVFNADDPGLPDGIVSRITMVGDSPNGIPGNIIFETQDGGAVPGSELTEIMRVHGGGVGIKTGIPDAELQVFGGTSLGSAFTAGHPGRTGSTPGASLSVRSPAASYGTSEPGGFVIEGGTTADGSFPGFSVINCNTWLAGGQQWAQPAKLGWRSVFDQRAGIDRYSLDTRKSGTGTGIQREYIIIDGLTGITELNAMLVLDNDAIPPSEVSPAVCRPKGDFTVNLGSATHRYKDLWVDAIQPVSDRNAKKDIMPLGGDRGLSFIKGLDPVKYKMRHGASGRTHYGFIAQDVESLFSDLGDTDGTGNGMVVKEKRKVPDPDWVRPTKFVPDPDWEPVEGKTRPYIEIPDPGAIPPLVDSDVDVYGLRYTELIAPLVKAVQEMSLQITSLKTKVSDLETRLTAVEA